MEASELRAVEDSITSLRFDLADDMFLLLMASDCMDESVAIIEWKRVWPRGKGSGGKGSGGSALLLGRTLPHSLHAEVRTGTD